MQNSNLRILKTFWSDWATALAIMLTSILIGRIPPPKVHFSPVDPTISYPHGEEQISKFLVVLLSLGFPILAILFVSWRQSSFITLHHGALGLITSGTLTLFFVTLTKVSLGEFRPDWVARCIPTATTLITRDGCTQQNTTLLLDGQKSFMSGHAGASFAGFFFLSLFLANHLELFSTRRSTRRCLFRYALTLAPLAFPVWVAISRITDYRHHPHDVIAGAITGILAASISYFIYSPTKAHDSAFENLDLNTGTAK